jgi:hypothetical protein
VARDNTKINPIKSVAKMIVFLVITLQVIKQRVLLVIPASTNPVATKQVANPIALPVFPLTKQKRPVPNALTNTKIKQIKPGVKIVPLVLP